MSTPIVTKMLIGQQVGKYKEFVNNNKDSIKVVDFSTTYGIFDVTAEGDFKDTERGGSIPDFEVKTYNVKNILGLYTLIEQEYSNPNFYGMLMLDESKHPFNILSYNFYRKFTKFKGRTDFDVFVYYVKGTPKLNNKIYQKAVDMVFGLDILDFNITVESDGDVELYFKTPKHLEDYGLHLSDYHIKVNDTPEQQAVTLDEAWLWECDVVSEGDMMSSELLKNPWAVECSIIDSGIVIPAYGWFRHSEGTVKPLICSTLHPNISSDGGSYCTGSNLKYSVTGVAELTYGNLTSPMNTSIWKGNSYEIAKAFIRVYWEVLQTLDLD